MPELPEIEVIRRSLVPIIGQKITSVQKNRADLRYPIPPKLETQLRNKNIIDLRRRSRYLIMDLSNSFSLIWHLGMSGKLFTKDKSYSVKKHDHIVIKLSNQSQLIFNDPRRFGMIDLLKTGELPASRWLANVGVEPLTDQFNAKYLTEVTHKRHAPIKSVLMNNNLIAGVGNIYANESLFYSHIHPQKQSCDLTETEITTLVEAIKQILSRSIELGGSSLKDFIDSLGKKGSNQEHFLIYGRKECSSCASEINKIKQLGRATYVCPTCQKS